MYSIGDVVKVVEWEEMENLTDELYNCGNCDEEIMEYIFEYSMFNDFMGKDISGQFGIITDILRGENIDCYEIDFIDDNLRIYDGAILDERLLKSYDISEL